LLRCAVEPRRGNSKRDITMSGVALRPSCAPRPIDI